MQKPWPALFWFHVLPKPPGCCEVSTLRSGWWKDEMQMGAERKSPTKPRGRRKGRSCYGFNTQYVWNSNYIFYGSLYCQSLSYSWSEVGKAGSGGLARCRWIVSRGYTREMAVVWWSFAMGDQRGWGKRSALRLCSAWDHHRPWPREDSWCMTWWEVISPTPKPAQPHQGASSCPAPSRSNHNWLSHAKARPPERSSGGPVGRERGQVGYSLGRWQEAQESCKRWEKRGGQSRPTPSPSLPYPSRAWDGVGRGRRSRMPVLKLMFPNLDIVLWVLQYFADNPSPWNHRYGGFVLLGLL